MSQLHTSMYVKAFFAWKYTAFIDGVYMYVKKRNCIYLKALNYFYLLGLFPPTFYDTF